MISPQFIHKGSKRRRKLANTSVEFLNSHFSLHQLATKLEHRPGRLNSDNMSPPSPSAAKQTRKRMSMEELALSSRPDLKPQGNQPPAKRVKYEECKQEQVEPVPAFKREDSPPATLTTSKLEVALAEYNKTTEAIARDEAKLRERRRKKGALNEEIIMLRRETRVKARKDAVFDIDDREVEYLATSHFQNAVLKLRSSQWVKTGKQPLPAVVHHIKSVLFDALTNIDDQQLKILLGRMNKYW